ncbi:MAG: BspA family leucine-rich repeat surface protein [Bifidobacterium sp.]|nr:BspA family leucine-rich repeat surface protein [Bifidobacterium sp.]
MQSINANGINKNTRPIPGNQSDSLNESGTAGSSQPAKPENLGNSNSVGTANPTNPNDLANASGNAPVNSSDQTSRDKGNEDDSAEADGQTSSPKADTTVNSEATNANIQDSDQPKISPQGVCQPIGPTAWGPPADGIAAHTVNYSITADSDGQCTLHLTGGVSPDFRPVSHGIIGNIPWLSVSPGATPTGNSFITKVQVDGDLMLSSSGRKHTTFDGLGAFANMSNLRIFDTSHGVFHITQESALYLFYNDLSLNSLPGITDWDVSGATDLAAMFQGAHLPNYLGLSRWNTSHILSTHAMFLNAEAPSIDISGWDTSGYGYTNVNGAAFEGGRGMFPADLIKLVIGPKAKLDYPAYTANGAFMNVTNNDWVEFDGPGTNAQPTGWSGTSAEVMARSATSRPNGTTYLARGLTAKMILNANGGTDTVANRQPTVISTSAGNSRFTVPDISEFTNKPHCLFTGWNTQADGGGTAYQPGNTIPAAGTFEDVNLYAQWKTIPTPAIGSATLNTSDNTVTVIGTAKPYASGDRVEVCTKPTSQTADYNTATQCLTVTINDTSAAYDDATNHSWSVTFPTSLFPSNANYTFQAKLITADSWHSNADADSERTAAFTQDLFPIRQSALPLTGPTNHHDLAVGLTAGAIVMLGLAVTNFKRRQFLRG